MFRAVRVSSQASLKEAFPESTFAKGAVLNQRTFTEFHGSWHMLSQQIWGIHMSPEQSYKATIALTQSRDVHQMQILLC